MDEEWVGILCPEDRVKSRVVLLIFFAVACFAHTSATTASWTCDEPVYDFGQAAETVLVTHVFVLRNSGSQPIRIDRVQPACGCTTTTLSSNEVAPGGRVDLTVTATLRGRTGAQRFTVSVRSNDPDNPLMTLVMRGTVAEDIRARPAKVAFAKVRAGERTQALVTLESAGPENFSITQIESSDPRLVAEVSSARPGRVFLLNFSMDPATTDGEFRGEVTVHTDHPRRPLIHIPVSLFTKPVVIVRPTALTVSMEMEALPQQQVLIVFSPDAQPFTITEVVKPDESMEVAVKAVSPYRYDIEVDNLVPGPELATPLLIKTSLGITIQVPFRMVDRQQEPGL